MRKHNHPTLQDVAREVGVSSMTVSVVLNNVRSSARVSDAMRARIMEAAARLNYRPNAVARGLQRRRMETLGVVFIIDGVEVNLYFLEVLNGILEAAAARDQNATIFSIPRWEDNEDKVLQCCDGRVDGLILIAPYRLTPEFMERLHQRASFVMIHGNEDAPNICNLTVDNESAAYALTRHLIEAGHRRIAHFPGGVGVRDADQRHAGYCRALAEAGIVADPALVLPGSFSTFSGMARAERMLAEMGDNLPTAIFCASDAIALGCMEVLAGRGLQVPDDISIVGFDDTLSARITNPPLTTARQPFRQMGRRAVELLLAQVQAGEGDTPASSDADSGTNPPVTSQAAANAVTRPEPAPFLGCTPASEKFAVEIVIRKSVGPPPGHASALL